MRVERTRRTKRALAALLVLAMVLSFLPGNLLAHAATEQHPDAVTITVVDEDGQPVQGASVAITVDSASNEQNNIDKTETTDQNGTVEVMSSSAFVADDLTLSATVTADGFEEKTLAETKIQTAEDDFQVELTSTTINDVTIEGKTLTYNGEKQELVFVTQVEGDTVTYEAVDGTSYELNREGKPVAVNAGTYEIKVTVKRDGKDDLVETVTTVIDPANIEGISIQGKTLSYNEKEQELVELTGDFQDGDVVTWIVNSESTQSKDVPQRMAVGTYTVQLKVDRGSNYKLVTEEVTTEITKGTLNLEGLTVTGLNGEYTVDEDGTPVAQPAVDVQVDEEHKGDYTLMYQLDDGDQEPDENAWDEDVIPKVTNAGSYIVWVKAVKANYNDSEVPVIPAEDAIAPYNVYIAMADQTFDFDEYDAHTSENDRETITLSGLVPYENVTYDFSATDTKALAGGTITYRVECEEGVASIGNDGILTVNYPGDINVFATLSGNNNYNECVIEYYLNVTGEVSAQGDYISFPTQQVDYTLGTSDTISTQRAEKTNDRILGDVTYSMDAVEGVEINEQSGALTVTDYDALAAAIRGADGALNITVTATKAEHDFYGQDTASYTVTVCFEKTPTEPYTLPAATGENGWYTTSVVVTPAARHTIAQSASGAFDKNTTFSDQGSAVRYVYLKNAITGGITDRIPVNIKIDTLPSDPSQMKIEIQELTIVEKMGLYFGFFNPSVNIKFIVEDEMETGESGVDHVKWFYTKSEDATSSILAEKSGTLDVAKEDGKYVATLTLPASEAEQYRGHIAFEAYDAAGNPSAKVTEDNVIIVVDTIHPTMDASFRLADENGVYNPVDRNGVKQHYFNGDVAFTFTIKEANFFSEDVEIGVTKDNAAHDVDVEWTVDETDDEVHYGTFTLSGDGDYVVTMSYPEQSGNVMLDNEGNEVELYTSEVITIDTVQPEIEFEYVHDGDVQKTIFTVEEHNFSAQHIVVTGTMQDANTNPVGFTAAQLTEILRDADWAPDGDTYTFEYDQYVNGIYNLTLDYTDYVGWKADSFDGDQFTIDHDGPTGVKIEYAKSPLDEFLEFITLGFYNPSVTVRFTAYDASAGVESFTWGYTKEQGASTINHPETLEDRTIPAEQKDKSDLSKYTAETTLTADEFTQYRGYLSVVATDTFHNDSAKKVDNGNIVVVDTIAPKMTVEYTPADREVGNTYYYNNDVEVRFTVTEANFYAEDVKVYVTKDGEAFDYGTVHWGTRDANDHTVGTMTLPAPNDHSGDGDYVITVEYLDRSGNEMVKYVSDTYTIDTALPEINVAYQNRSVVNTLQDREEHDRRYFADTQTAVVTITEHNFNPEDVNYDIIAQDVTGAKLELDDLVTMSEWKTQGDVHTMTITYPGDANYTFDVAYADLATNEALDYATDYFTVDKTAPTNLRVEYSTSVLDTVLESVSFGFYNAKMTVTISADDTVSGVHSFLYSYLNAAGVSSVNAQLIDQAIAAANIRYSNNGVTATASFEIPKMLLGSDNQFNGTVEFTATDRSGIESVVHREAKRIVVDNISPTAQVTYNDPVNTEGNIAYYDGNIQATISVREANFYANDVQVTVSKDGGAATAVPTSWTDNSVDTHTGTFTLSGDGDYIVTINYRDKSSNQMETYTSQQMTIDTQIENPTFSINGQTVGENGGAYKDEAEIAFAFDDINFDTQTVQLVRTRYDAVEDVTDEFIKIGNTETGGSGSFSIPAEVGNDGIYTLTVEMTDKALHTTQSQMKFTINRFGSVYEYDDYLMSLIQDGGQYITIQDGETAAITKDLVITEYNADQLLEGSLQILITRDGESVEADYTTNPATIDDATSIGESGWYQYVYTIKASNFSEDGVYKIALSSAYATSDSGENDSTSVPENSMDGSGAQVMDTMTFTVDTTAPEIRNIVNLEKEIINAQSVDVKYTIVDVGGLKSVEVVVNGKVVDNVTQFNDGGFNYNGQFTIQESNSAQTVQLKVTDLAGNVTDTAAEDFNANELFVFHDTVTVSTNVFVRWYANKPLFWGSICGVVVVVGAICGVVATKRKKKVESK